MQEALEWTLNLAQEKIIAPWGYIINYLNKNELTLAHILNGTINRKQTHMPMSGLIWVTRGGLKCVTLVISSATNKVRSHLSCGIFVDICQNMLIYVNFCQFLSIYHIHLPRTYFCWDFPMSVKVVDEEGKGAFLTPGRCSPRTTFNQGVLRNVTWTFFWGGGI